MNEEYFDTLEECRRRTENGVVILLEKPIYSSKTGEVYIVHALAKKDDKYTIILYSQASNPKYYGKWYSCHKNVSKKEYLSAENFILSIVESFFRQEHKRIVKVDNN